MRGYGVNPPATTPPPPPPGKSKKTKVEVKDNMTYQDTATMMFSDDYKERFKAEYWQLKIRYVKLRMNLISFLIVLVVFIHYRYEPCTII